MNFRNRTEKRLAEEVKELIEISGLNVEQINELEDAARIPVLETIKMSYIRNEVISDYVFADEMLDLIIRHYFLPKEKGKSAKMKRLQALVLERMYLAQKVDLASSLPRFHKDIKKKLFALNDIRNGMAHSFLPESRARNKPVWAGKSLYSLENFKHYKADIQSVHDYLLKKALGLRSRDLDFRNK